MCKFQAGDVVRLKSDTSNITPMTIQGYKKDESQFKSESIFLEEISDDILKAVLCKWRDSYGRPHFEYYHEDSLTKIDD